MVHGTNVKKKNLIFIQNIMKTVLCTDVHQQEQWQHEEIKAFRRSIIVVVNVITAYVWGST